MRRTIAQVAGVLAARGGSGGSTPWPGWPASRLILARFELANCLSPSTDRVTMDTIMWPARSSVALSRLWWAAAKVGQFPDAIRAKCIVVEDTFVALKQFARAVRETWGGKIAGVTGSVGKTTTKEILGGIAWRAVPRSEVGRKF